MSRSKRRKTLPKQEPVNWLTHLPKIIAGLLATGAVGGTTLSYNTSTHADERTAIVETKVAKLELDAGQTAKDLKKIDRRTIRIETLMQQIGEKQGIHRPYGPSEE